MGWQKDEIEEMAEELGIDGGDSWSQQDRLRNISEQVGMEHFDGISNDDTDILQQKLRERKAEKDRNINNNAENVRAAANILKDKGIPYASAIAAGVDAADKISGGRSSRALGKKLNTINKLSPGGRKRQKQLNKLAESGATDAINNMAGAQGGDKNTPNAGQKSNERSRSGVRNSQVRGDIKLKLPVQVKITIWAVLIIFALISLTIFVLFGAKVEINASGSGRYEYGKTCTKVTVENTGCDDLGNNCTLIYDGEVEFENYIAGIVAAEVGNANNLEFYKLAAITTRSYVLSNINDNCKVEGNNDFKKYIDVKDSSNASLIKQAVEETKQLVILKNDGLLNPEYSPACVVKDDGTNYHLRYGNEIFENVQMQEIPKSWDDNNTAFPRMLTYLYLETDSTDTDYENKSCPGDNNDYGLSQIGAYYLITEEGYSYESAIKYYYGSDIEVVTNEMHLSGAEGFINPTRRINCSSPFGPRPHPVSGEPSNHTGIDIAIAGGEPIYAAKDGIVAAIVDNVSAINNCDYGYGNYIIINHEDGMATLYAHIKYGTVSDSISVGESVSQGEQIGAIGSTGCSTGNHLHYEVRQNGTRIDPADYIDLTDATGTCRR